jgi:stage II sporulation protein AA (anti-sigma F factor antagonist)
MTTSQRSPDGPAPGPTEGLLRVDVQRADPDAVVMVLRGDLDRASAPILAVCLAEHLGLVGPGGTVVVNLAGVDFVDVGGMLLLLGATRRTSDRGGTLYLAGCDAMLIRLLELTGNLHAANLVAAQPDGASGTNGGDG